MVAPRVLHFHLFVLTETKVVGPNEAGFVDYRLPDCADYYRYSESGLFSRKTNVNTSGKR